jgi:hypothetical protein
MAPRPPRTLCCRCNYSIHTHSPRVFGEVQVAPFKEVGGFGLRIHSTHIATNEYAHHGSLFAFFPRNANPLRLAPPATYLRQERRADGEEHRISPNPHPGRSRVTSCIGIENSRSLPAWNSVHGRLHLWHLWQLRVCNLPMALGLPRFKSRRLRLFHKFPTSRFVSVLALEGLTWRDTREEALQRINELLNALVQMRIEKGQPIPTAISLNPLQW